MGHGKRKKSSSNDLIALPVSPPLVKSNPQQSSPVGSSSYQQRLEQLMLRASSSSPGTGRGTSQSVFSPVSPSVVGGADIGTSSQSQQRVLVSRATSTPKGASEGGVKENSQFLSPGPSPLGKSPHRGAAETGSGGNSTHLPPPRTIRRGDEPLRRINNHDSPVQRSLGTAAVTSKMEYQAKIATWAATRVPCLGALYGLRLMSNCRASGISSPLVNSQCERCSIVLVPGVNCSVRDAQQKKKKRRRRTNTKDGQAADIGSTVVHVCLYCKHENKKSAPSSKQHGKTRFAKAASPVVVTTPSKGEMEALANKSADPSSTSPFTPTAEARSGTPGSSIVASVGQGPQSSGKKRKRKGWTSLKAVATSLHERGQASGNQSSGGSSSSTPSSVLGTRTFAEGYIKLSDNGGRTQEPISPVTPASIVGSGKNKKRRRPSGLKDMSTSSLNFE